MKISFQVRYIYKDITTLKNNFLLFEIDKKKNLIKLKTIF